MSVKTKSYLIENFDFKKQFLELRNNPRIAKSAGLDRNDLFVWLKEAIKYMKEHNKPVAHDYSLGLVLSITDRGKLVFRANGEKFVSTTDYEKESLLFFCDDKDQSEQIKELIIKYSVNIQTIKPSLDRELKLINAYHMQYGQGLPGTAEEVKNIISEAGYMLIVDHKQFSVSSTDYMTIDYCGYFSPLRIAGFLSEFFDVENFTIMNIPYGYSDSEYRALDEESRILLKIQT